MEGLLFRQPLWIKETAGMSLRDYFAGHALSGETANNEWDSSPGAERNMAEWCYKLADAMIAARDS